jgi:hypothetical protein
VSPQGPLSEPSREILSGGMAESEYIDYLKVEIDHFYRAELHSEQRASWLLTASIGALALVLNGFVLITDHKMRAELSGYLSVCAAAFFCSALWALRALWPLGGRRGVLCNPFRRLDRNRLPSREIKAVEQWKEHYGAHRTRAALKTARVVQTILLFLVGVAASMAAIGANGGLMR